MNDTIWYTSRGDDGTTGLLGDQRVKKYHSQPEACGDVDEVSSSLGLARALMQDEAAKATVIEAQRDLYKLMAELAATPAAAPQFRQIDAERVAWLEAQTDHYGALITMPREFVVPGDTAAGGALDLARTIIRRAERRVVKLIDDELVENRELMRYLNRLSSLIYVLARYEDALSGASSVTIAKDA